jgi:hypothetical protein
MAKLETFIDEEVGSELEKKGVTEADIELVGIKGGASAIGIFDDAFRGCLQQVRNTFRIMTGGNRTTEEVVAAGNYDWKNDWVNGKNFPMRPMSEGPREIVYLEFDYDPASEEVLAEAQRQGLERPRHDDVLFFGEQYLEEQRKAPVVFLHEPWHYPHRGLFVLVLYCGCRGRGLDLNYFGVRWRQRCRFAFVHK